MSLKAEHQIRMIMAYRAAGAKFYIGDTNTKWVHFGKKRFYRRHYQIACGVEKNMKKLRSRELAWNASRTTFAHVKGILREIGANPMRVIATVKKALKR